MLSWIVPFPCIHNISFDAGQWSTTGPLLCIIVCDKYKNILFFFDPKKEDNPRCHYQIYAW